MRRCTPRCARWAIVLASVVIGLQVLGNAAIAASSLAARVMAEQTPGTRVDGVNNFRVVDGRVWRGAAPTDAGYRWLAEHGVTAVIDLRAEGSKAPRDLLRDLGIDLVRLPVRDGELPTQRQIDEALAVIKSADGRVFVHCSAGVGRTGAIIVFYLVETGSATGLAALMRNLAVGPPSLEQIVFVAGADRDGVRKPGSAVVIASRFLDAPRKLWGWLT